MRGGVQCDPRTIDEVFHNFMGRRAGVIKALTTDVEEFYKQCHPDKENLCLYGFPDEQWEVDLPVQQVPSQLPEPILGINFARDAMQKKEWLTLVGLHSDVWLRSVAFFFGAKVGFDKDDRKVLFTMINDLPTIFEVLSRTAEKQTEEKLMDHSSSKSNSKRGPGVEEVFKDFKGRRAGIIKALTTDVAKFYQQCNPEDQNLCLYGLPDEQWEVSLPVEEVPSQLPEPTLGINFARDGMQKEHWLTLVSLHSDVWLLSVAFFFGDALKFDKDERERLFNMINDLPTAFEVFSRTAGKQTEENSSVNQNSSKSYRERGSASHTEAIHMKSLEDEEENEELSICIEITSDRAEHSRCPSCSNK